MPLGTDGAAWLIDGIETNLTDEAGVGSTVDWSLSAQTTGQTDMNGVILENATTVTTDTDGTANTGPAGGTSTKPIGLTYIGLATGEGAEVRRFTWTGDREANRRASVEAALAWLVERAAATGVGS